MDDIDADYITLLPTTQPDQFLVCVMKWHKTGEEYIQSKVSHPLSEKVALALATSWAAALHLEVK